MADSIVDMMARVVFRSDEAAKRLRVSVDTLLRWVKAGKFPGFKTPGGQYRFRLDDIAAYEAGKPFPSVLEKEKDKGKG